jgi:hypothetical protein
MAILKGFPPSNTISPSIRITEKDLSFVAAAQSLHRAGLIGFASKGPMNLPILISTSKQLTTVFGNPHPESGDPYLIYAAQQYLLVANELYVVRVGDEDPVSDEQATVAMVDVPSAGTSPFMESNTVGPYLFDPNPYPDSSIVVDAYFLRYKLNGVLQPKTLIVTSSNSAKDVADVVDELNSQLDPILDGVQFELSDSVDDNSPIRFKAVWAYGPQSSIEVVSVQNSMVGSGMSNILGIGTGMKSAYVVGTNSYHGGMNVPGNYEFPGSSDWMLEIVLDGTDNVTIDGVVQVLDLNMALDLGSSPITNIDDIATAINQVRYEEGGDLPGGWEAYASGSSLGFRTIHSGADARLRIKPTPASSAFGISSLTQSGESPEGASDAISTASFGVVTGADNTTGETTFTIMADSPGIDGNQTQVKITNNIRENNFTLEVYNNGVQVESWGGLTKNTLSSYYVETYLSLVSDYVRVSDNMDVSAGPADRPIGSSVGTYYSLSGGSDGIPSDPDKQDELLIGSAVGSTGLYVLSEPEQVDIDLIAVPGHSSTSVVQAMLDFCQNYRMDCLAIIDPPFGLTVKEIIELTP